MPDEAVQLEGKESDDKSSSRAVTHDDLSMYCQDLYQEYSTSSYRQEKLDEIADGRKRYKGSRDPKSFPWKDSSNLSMMLSSIAVDNLEPRLKAQLIAEDSFINVEPVGPEDEKNAESTQDFMHWAVTSNINVSKEIKPLLHDLLLDGTKDIIPMWFEERVENHIRTAVPMFQTPDGREIELPPEMVSNSQAMQMLQRLGVKPLGLRESIDTRPYTNWKVKYETIPLSDAFFPDTGQNWDEQPYLRFIYPTMEELEGATEENGGPYKNISDDLVVDPGRTSDEESDLDADRKGVQHSQWTREVKLIECHVKWRGEWMLVTYAIDAAWREVRKQDMGDVFWHGRKPVKRFRIFPESNESMGTGIPTKIVHFDKGIDDLFNMMIDSGTIEIIPYFFYEATPGGDMTNKTISPGRGVRVPKGSNITHPQTGVKSVAVESFIQVLLGFFERIVSLSDYTLGRQSQSAGKGGETYSGMALIVQEGNIKHQYQGESLRDVFAELISDTRLLYAQYMPLDAKRRIQAGDQSTFEPIDAMSIQGNFDMTIQISDTSANKMLARKEAVELYQLTRQDPAVNPVPSITKVLKSYGVKDIEANMRPGAQMLVEALAANPELTKVVQAYLQQKQAAARDEQIAAEATSNIKRQKVERDVEAPFEDEKILDQSKESIKRQAVKPVAEEQLLEEFGGV